MGMFRAKADDARPKTPLRQRFKAWWEGEELAEPEPEAVVEAKVEDNLPAFPTESLPPLEEPIVRLSMAVWGEGNSKPGDRDYYLHLVQPLNLTPTTTLLDFGCGLGGGGRAIANALPSKVSGMEQDQVLAAAGKALSLKPECANPIEITRYDPKKGPVKPRHYESILCVDKMHTILSKTETLTMLRNALQPRGQLVLADVVLGDGVGSEDKRLSEVLGEGASRSQFWSPNNYFKAFKDLKLDLQSNEDITERYRKLVKDAWDAFIKSESGLEISRAFPQLTMSEVQYWQRLLLAMDAGLLRVYRFHAVNPS
jgi:cyclopropane fatty-acyl-phospholipid synthase-like methyltransferase